MPVKSVRTAPVYRLINEKCVKRCVAPTPNEHESKIIHGDGATHLEAGRYRLSLQTGSVLTDFIDSNNFEYSKNST